MKRCHIQQKSEDYICLHSWSPLGRAQSNCRTFALDKTKSETNEQPLRLNSECGCLTIPSLILCLWKTLKAVKESSKIGRLCFWGVTEPILIILESYTWPHLEHRKIPLTPNGIILQTAALSLSLYHCRAKSIWDSHNCYHLFNPPSKSRSSLPIKYLECLCSPSRIIVHH